jgi:ParB/RepB/Spo0J family partition protein
LEQEIVMQRVFRLVDTAELRAVGTKTTSGFYRSVQRHGIINPIIVAEVADADGVIGLEIVDGNRRVRAAKAARMEKIPAVVLKETSPEDRARLTLMANHLRSANFHTESLAVSLLADNDEEARRAAAEMGVTPSKLQGIHKKLATMPAEILKAMYEGRVPVSSATSIAGWPEELQRQIVTLLQREHRLITPMIDEVRRDYERQHPPSPKTPRFESLPPAPEPPPFDDWFEDDPSAFFAPSDRSTSGVDPVRHPTDRVPRHSPTGPANGGGCPIVSAAIIHTARYPDANLAAQSGWVARRRA